MIRLSLIALVLISSLGNAIKVEKDGWGDCFDLTPDVVGGTDTACQVCQGGKSIFDEAQGSTYCPSAGCRRDSCNGRWGGCKCPDKLLKDAYINLSPGGLKIEDLSCGVVGHGKPCGAPPVCKTDFEYVVYGNTTLARNAAPFCDCSSGTCQWVAGACFKKCTGITTWPQLRSKIADVGGSSSTIIAQDESGKPTEYTLAQRLAPDNSTEFKTVTCLSSLSITANCPIPASSIPCAFPSIANRNTDIIAVCEPKAGSTGEVDYSFVKKTTEVTCGLNNCQNTTTRTNCVDQKFLYRDQMVCDQVVDAVATSKSGSYCVSGVWNPFVSNISQMCDVPNYIRESCGVAKRNASKNIFGGMKCPIKEDLQPLHASCQRNGYTCTPGQDAPTLRFLQNCLFANLSRDYGYDSCWLGNQTGILKCIAGGSCGSATFPHGQQCIPMCKAGAIRQGTEGPYCVNGTWVKYDRQGRTLSNIATCKINMATAPVGASITRKLPELCAAENMAKCKPCTFQAAGGDRFLYDNIVRVGEITNISNANRTNMFIDWPYCGNMKHMETAQVVCREGLVLSGNTEYVQCYNGNLYLGGWIYDKEFAEPNLTPASVDCVRLSVPAPVVVKNDTATCKANAFHPDLGRGFQPCQDNAPIDAVCIPTCSAGFIKYASTSFLYEFKTYINSSLTCRKKDNEPAYWVWTTTAPESNFACMDVCRAGTAGDKPQTQAPGKCDPSYLCDNVCSLYNAEGYECTGPACQYDGGNCARTKKDRLNFGYNVTLNSFSIEIAYDSPPAETTWLGIYSSASSSNQEFLWAKFIGKDGSDKISVDVDQLRGKPVVVNGSIQWSNAISDLTKSDYEFRIFADLMSDSATLPIFTSGLCFGGACQGKIATHKIETASDVMKKKGLHAVTQEVFDLLQPELHLNDREEFNRRIDIIRKVEEHAQRGESPAELWEDMYVNIKDSIDPKAHYEITMLKRRTEQVQQLQQTVETWKLASVPGRCLSLHPDCVCEAWGNGTCNQACNFPECQYDGLDCGCLVSEMFADNATSGIWDSSFTQCNNKVRGEGSARYYPAGTECRVQCADNRVTDAGSTGILRCDGNAQRSNGGQWSHNCLPPCPFDMGKIIDSLKVQADADNDAARKSALELDRTAGKFKGCDANNSKQNPTENLRGICIVACDGLKPVDPAQLRIECRPQLGMDGQIFGKPVSTWALTESSKAVYAKSAAGSTTGGFCPSTPLPSPPSPPTPPSPPVKCTAFPDKFSPIGDCANKDAGAKCDGNCTGGLKYFGEKQLTCQSTGQWTGAFFCLNKCPMPTGGTANDRNGAVALADSCKDGIYPSGGNPNSCDYVCGNNTKPGNQNGGKLYDNTACPSQISCSLVRNDSIGLALVSTSGSSIGCYSACQCSEIGQLLNPSRNAKCNTNQTWIGVGSPVPLTCGTDSVLDATANAAPYCYDDIKGKSGVFKWLKPDGTGIKAILQALCKPTAPAPPLPPSPPTPPSPPPATPAPPSPPATCSRATLLEKYKEKSRTWYLKFEYAVTGKYNPTSQTFDSCTGFNDTFVDQTTFEVNCNPDNSDGSTGKQIKCNNGVWTNPDCPTQCRAVRSAFMTIPKTLPGQVGKVQCDPGYVIAYQRNTAGIWEYGPVCNPSTLEYINMPFCVHQCFGGNGTGTCSLNLDTMCDGFCNAGDLQERNCLVPACKSYANTSVKCPPTQVRSLTAVPTKITVNYWANAPLPQNAHVEINELSSVTGAIDVNRKNYFFYLPQIAYTDAELSEETTKYGSLVISSGVVHTNSTRPATFQSSKLQFTFYQDLGRDPTTALASGHLCGGTGKTTQALCNTFTPSKTKPLVPDVPANITAACAQGGCSCGQIGDGVCDLACLNPECAVGGVLGESQDCRCYNPDFFVRGGVLKDCDGNSSKEVGQACTFTCPGETVDKQIKCQITSGSYVPTFTWDPANLCKRQCTSVPYINHKTDGVRHYIKFDDPNCNGLTNPVKHGTQCFPACAVGTPVKSLWYECNDGDWVLSGSLATASAYCSVGGDPCKFDEFLNTADTKIDAIISDKAKSVTGVLCTIGGQQVGLYTNGSKANQSIPTGAICSYQCQTGYEPSGVGSCNNAKWGGALSTMSCNRPPNCTFFQFDRFFSGGTYECKDAAGQAIDLTKFNSTSDRPAGRGTTCTFTCSSSYTLTPPSGKFVCSTTGVARWLTSDSPQQAIFDEFSKQSIYYPICHPPCTFGVPVDGQSNGTSVCSNNKVFSPCSGWSCGASPAFTRDTCSSTKEPICFHGSFVNDTTDNLPSPGVPMPAFVPICESIDTCWKWCVDNPTHCNFDKLENRTRIWGLGKTLSQWHRKLPYCFAPCNSVKFTASLNFKCQSDWVTHGVPCNVVCNDKDSVWMVATGLRGTVENAFGDFPMCYDGVFKGNAGMCVGKNSANGAGSDSCKYSELNQFLQEQKILGFKCQERNVEGATFKTTCQPDYSWDTTAEKDLTVTCKRLPNKLLGWVYSFGKTEVPSYVVPKCIKPQSCEAKNTSDIPGSVGTNGILCPKGTTGTFCTVQCQEGYIPVHQESTKTPGRTEPGLYCDETGNWTGTPECKESCSVVMGCLPHNGKNKYNYKCDGVCQSSFLGHLDAINCAGPACAYDAAAPSDTKCPKGEVFGAVLEDTRRLTYVVIIPVGKRLTNKAWVAIYIAGEKDNQKYIDRYILRNMEVKPDGTSSQTVTFNMDSTHAKLLGSQTATDFEIRVFPDADWGQGQDVKPLVGTKVNKQGSITGSTLGSSGAAAPAASSSGPWLVIAIIFIILFVLTAIVAAVLFMKLRSAQSGGDNQYSKYTERL